MTISGPDLHKLVADGVITNVKPEQINAGSIDITCGPYYIVEPFTHVPIGLLEKSKASPLTIADHGFVLAPGASVLLESEQVFNLPTDPAIFAEYKLKSTMARNFVDAYNAGWCDAGWHMAKLTIELINHNKWRSVIIRPGDRIGQMIFTYGSVPVPIEQSYATKGRYNCTDIVTGAK